MKRILVGLSWWVDSAVAAYLLLQQGYDVTAGFMINYTTNDEHCTTKEDLSEAQRVASYLGIKLYTFDFQTEYHERIVRYIIDSYKNWLTPNPDVLCNSEIKFKLFLDEWIALWFDGVATGHYARILSDHKDANTPLSIENTRYKLLKWVDANKDQSYFLAGLNQEQLSKSLFPLGDLTKPQVREIAKEAGLPNADRKDSQGICFIGKVPMKTFLQQYIPTQTWHILNTAWQIIGEHDWAWWYTIGQRRWIGFAWKEPLFVIKKDIKENTITLGTSEEADLYNQDILVSHWHRIGEEYWLPFHGHAKIRYRQDDKKMILDAETASDDKSLLHAHFIESQRAVASGQILVAYNGDEVIWSGIIV